MTDRRRSYTRPRTRVYDTNYNIGESYYKSALDNLDRKYGRLPVETLEAPKRPVSVGDLDSWMTSERGVAGPSTSFDRAAALDGILKDEEQMMSTLKRIQRARAAVTPSAEENFENAFFNRREEVKKKFSEKMLDSVGINGSIIDEDSLRRRRPPFDEDLPKVTQKWTALRDQAAENLDETAAKARARASRVRLADLENEMEEMAERGAARERRIANLRSLLSSEVADSEEIASGSATRIRKRVTISSAEERMA